MYLPNAMDTLLSINGTRVPGADQRIGRDLRRVLNVRGRQRQYGEAEA